ncbi:hypothetical protein [Rhodomicrobium sp.]|uniref:hypothetical protein n=1 Tax=Rhodomicrobium sp. TaxID=2720632 RepID=UPI0039E63B46
MKRHTEHDGENQRAEGFDARNFPQRKGRARDRSDEEQPRPDGLTGVMPEAAVQAMKATSFAQIAFILKYSFDIRHN